MGRDQKTKPTRRSVPPPPPPGGRARQSTLPQGTPPPPPPVKEPRAPADPVREGIEFLDQEISSVDPRDRRRLALLHLEVARLMDEAGEPVERLIERSLRAVQACPELAFVHREHRRHLRAAGRAEDVIRSMDQELSVVRDPRSRAGLCVLRGRYARDTLRSKDGALDFAKALALDPASASAVEALRSMHMAGGDWEELARTLERAAGSCTGARAHELRADAALVREHLLDQAGAAAGLHAAVLAGKPDDALAVAAAERNHGRSGKYDELLEIVERQADATRLAGVKMGAYTRAGTLAAERLDDPERAIRLFALASEVDPRDPAPVDARADLMRRSGDWEGYERMLALRSTMTAGTIEALTVALTRATVMAERLDRPGDAIDLCASALEADPTNAGLRTLLCRLLASAGRHAERVKLELLAAERIEDPVRRAAAMYVAGTTCETLEEGRALAVGAYTRALAALPGHRPAFEALRGLFERAGQHKELADLLARRIEVATDPVEKRALYARLASVSEERLGEPEASIAALEGLLGLPGTETGNRPVLWDLQRLHAQAGRHEAHADALRAEALVVTDPEVRAELMWRCAVVAERRKGDIPAAIDALEEALRSCPGHRPSLDALVRMAEECGDWLEYMKNVDRGLAGLPDAEQAELLVRSARFASEVMGDDDEAVTRCEKALELAPGHPVALLYLRTLHEKHGRWAELARVMELSAVAEKDPARRAALRTRQADLMAEHLDDPSLAAAVYGQALRDRPDHLPALAGLERVGLRTGGWDGLVETYRQALAALELPENRLPWLRKLAVVLGVRVNKHEEARALIEEILLANPSDGWALRFGIVLDTADARWKATADGLARLAANQDDPAVAAALREEESCIRASRLDEDGLAPLLAALEAAPTDREVLEMLDPVRLPPEIRARVTRGWLARSNDPHERAHLLTGLAAIERQMGTSTWVGLLDQALAELSGHLPAVRAARDAAIERGDWTRAMELLQAEGRADVTCSPRARVEALSYAAALSMERRGDAARSRSDLESAFAIMPSDQGVVRDLGRLLAEHEQWRALADVLGKHAAAVPKQHRTTVLMQRAGVLRDRLQSPGEAATTLEQLLKIEPAHAEALLMLGDIYFASGSWQKSVQALRSAEDSFDRGTGQWRHARLRRAQVTSEKLGLHGEAESLLADALAQSPGDREMLGLLARVRRGARNWAGVEEVLGSLVRTAEPEEAVGLWVEACRVARARNDPQKLATCFERAATLSLDAPAGFESVRALAMELEAPDAAHMLKEVLYHAPADRLSGSGPMRLLVAELLAADQKMAAAEAEVRAALDLTPGDADAWVLLGRTASSMDDAHGALMEALRIDPFRQGIYETMVRMGERDPRFADMGGRAGQVLIAMGAFSTGASPARPPRGDRRLLRHQIISWVLSPAEPATALELLVQGGLKLGSLYPQPDHGPLEPVPRGNDLSLLVDSVARLFGVERYNLYYTSTHGVTASFVVDERPSVILGESLLTSPEPLLRFHLGRVFAPLATGSALALFLGADQMKALMDAMAGQQFTGMGDPVMVSRVAKVLGFMGRRSLGNAAREYATAPPDLSGWQAGAAVTSVRGGIIACADPSTVRMALHAMAGVPLPAPGSAETWEVSRSVPFLGEMLAYVVSPEYGTICSQVG